MFINFKQGYEYSRSGNPTRSCLEECLAALECAEYGKFMWKRKSFVSDTNAI